MLKRSTMVMLFLMASMVALTAGHAFSAVLVVPNNFPTIQAAVDVAQPGDTIYVQPGTYAGDVLVIEKNNLTLLGRKATIAGLLVFQYAENIVVQGFNFLQPISTSGVGIYDSKSITIASCQFSESVFGIYVQVATGVRLINNKFSQCSDAIYVLQCQGLYMSRNYVTGCNFGISWRDVRDAYALANEITKSNNWGWNIGRCHNNSFASNKITLNKGNGLDLSFATHNRFLDNQITGNDPLDIHIDDGVSDNLWLDNQYGTANVTPLP